MTLQLLLFNCQPYGGKDQRTGLGWMMACAQGYSRGPESPLSSGPWTLMTPDLRVPAPALPLLLPPLSLRAGLLPPEDTESVFCIASPSAAKSRGIMGLSSAELHQLSAITKSILPSISPSHSLPPPLPSAIFFPSTLLTQDLLWLAGSLSSSLSWFISWLTLLPLSFSDFLLDFSAAACWGLHLLKFSKKKNSKIRGVKYTAYGPDRSLAGLLSNPWASGLTCFLLWAATASMGNFTLPFAPILVFITSG